MPISLLCFTPNFSSPEGGQSLLSSRFFTAMEFLSLDDKTSSHYKSYTEMAKNRKGPPGELFSSRSVSH